MKFAYALAEFHKSKVSQQPEYIDSWKKRGGVIAFCNLNRKLERLDTLIEAYDQNLFVAFRNPSVIDCFKDILVYIMLHMQEAGEPTFLSDVAERSSEIGKKYGEPWQLTHGFGAWADVSRKIDSLRQFAKSVDFNLLGSLQMSERGSVATIPHERVRDLAGYMLMAVGAAVAADHSLQF